MAKPKNAPAKPATSKGLADHEYIGGWIPAKLKEKLRQQAREQHRTITHQFTFILESYYNNAPKGNNDAT